MEIILVVNQVPSLQLAVFDFCQFLQTQKGEKDTVSIVFILVFGGGRGVIYSTYTYDIIELPL